MQQIRNQRGTTIIELAIVAVMIGIAASLAVPRYMDYVPKLRAKSAARELVSALRECRSMAVAEKQRTGVYFDEVERSYIVFRDTFAPENEEFSTGDEILDTLNLTEGLIYDGDTFVNQCIVFDLDGSGNQSGSVVVRTGDYSLMFTIDVLASTGRVKMTTVENAG